MFHSTNNDSLALPKTTASASLSDFRIELVGTTDGCYRPGQRIRGRVVIAVSASKGDPVYGESVVENGGEIPIPQQIELMYVKLWFTGTARLKCKTKMIEAAKEDNYLNDEVELHSADNPPSVINAKCERAFEFEHTLPAGLHTSVESKNASILYCIRASTTYRTQENEIKKVNVACGITVVENFDLNRLPSVGYFEPVNYNLVRKFGLFSCTGGQIRLHFTVCRRAFVCGENVVIEGRIENKTDRRIDKVVAILQQVVVVHGNVSKMQHLKEGDQLSIFDVCDIHEDNLALFIDEGATLKIERNFALPPLPPSTFTLEGTDPAELTTDSKRNIRGSADVVPPLNMQRRFSSAFGGSMLSSRGASHCQSNFQRSSRFLKVLYQLSVRVKTGGTEVMEINVPLVIGSVPRHNHTEPQKGRGITDNASTLSVDRYDLEKGVLYLQNRRERPVHLAEPNKIYAYTSKSQLNYTNKYPFFVDLPTSSKQSRKVSMLANAIRAEANFAAALKSGLGGHSFGETSCRTPHPVPRPLHTTQSALMLRHVAGDGGNESLSRAPPSLPDSSHFALASRARCATVPPCIRQQIPVDYLMITSPQGAVNGYAASGRNGSCAPTHSTTPGDNGAKRTSQRRRSNVTVESNGSSGNGSGRSVAITATHSAANSTNGGVNGSVPGLAPVEVQRKQI